MKIISILTQTPQKHITQYRSGTEYKLRFPLTEIINIDKSPYWVGFFRLDWHHRWTMKVKEQLPDVDYECWRPYGNIIDQIYQTNVDGILHKVFPSKSIKVKKVGEITYSQLLLQEAILQIKANKQIVFHIYGAHKGFNTWLILNLRNYDIPIIVQHLGGWFGYFDYKRSKKNIFKLLPYFAEKYSLKFVKKYFTASVTEELFLKKTFPKLNYEFFLNGIDFSVFKPQDKIFAKIKLGIDPSSKMILYVGRFTGIKNVNILIDAFIRIKKIREDVVLYLVGGYKGEEFYQKGLDAGAVIVERSDQPINKYFAAADVYVMPVKDYGVKEFGGIGIAVLEALAMNIPVISENIKHCKGSMDEIKQLGISNPNYEALELDILHVLDNPNIYSNCREIAKKYFDIDSNTKHLLQVYENLILKCSN